MRKFLLLALLIMGVAQADEFKGHGRPDGIEPDEGGMFKDILSDPKPKIPMELEFIFPDLPALTEWAPVTFPQGIKTNDYYISLDSLSVGKDNIVRYVMAIVPKKGNVKNIVFEGLDCKTNQYRSYGWANSAGEWDKSSTVSWKPLTKNTYNGWQGHLSDDFCQMGSPWPVETIRKEFKVEKRAGDCLGCMAK